MAALLLLVLADRLNIKFKKRFFEDEEPYLGALAVFILGNPNWNYIKMVDSTSAGPKI